MGTPSVKNLKIVFFGTPDVAVGVLDALEERNILPALIVTAPDRQAGRGMKLTAPPAKAWAESRGIDVLQPESIADETLLDELQNTEWDLFLVAAYGKILPKRVLDLPRFKTLNVHPSLLPKLRGASPIESAILEDAKDAVGVSIMLMDEKMDHGPVLTQARIELEAWPPRASVLRALLSAEGGALLAETIPDWVAGNISPEAQKESEATFCGKFGKADAELDFSSDPYKNFLKIRAFDTSPRAFFFADSPAGAVKKIRVVVTDAEYKDGELRITRVIPEGKKEMLYEDFLKTSK